MLRIIASVFVALCGAFGVADAAAQQDDQNIALAVSQPEVAMLGEVDALERLSQPPASVQYSEISGEGGVLLERISQAAQFHQIEAGPSAGDKRSISAQVSSKVQPALFSTAEVAPLLKAAYQPGLDRKLRAPAGRQSGAERQLENAAVAWPDDRSVRNQITAAIEGYGSSSLASGGENPRQFEGVFDQRVAVEGGAVERQRWKSLLESPATPRSAPDNPPLVQLASAARAEPKAIERQPSVGSEVSTPALDPQEPTKPSLKASLQTRLVDAGAAIRIKSSAVSPDTYSRRAILTGRVYVDLNNDGVRQVGEPGLAGVEIVSGDAKHSFESDRSGFFASRSLREGAYEFSVDPTTLPLGFSVQSSRGRLATLRSFGAAHVDLPVVIVGQVSGALFVDLDADGRMSATDQLLEGEVVQLVEKHSGRVRTSRSASFGQFGFENVQPGDYVVRVNVGWQEYAVDVAVTEVQSLALVALAVPAATAGLQPAAPGLPKLLVADITDTKKPGSTCCRADYGQSDATIIRRLP